MRHRHLTVRRTTDGTLVIHPGTRPPAAERRLVQSLQIGGITVIGIGGLGLVKALSLTGTAATVGETVAYLALVVAAIIPLTRRWRRVDYVEIDWRREEVRVVGSRSTVTIGFDGLRGIEVSVRWPDLPGDGTTYEVWLVGVQDRIQVGEFQTEAEARAFEAELRDLTGISAPSV